jgi:hypothetical protein
MEFFEGKTLGFPTGGQDVVPWLYRPGESNEESAVEDLRKNPEKLWTFPTDLRI